MKICIDGLAITHLQGTGQFSYTFELLDNLFRMYPQPFYEIVLNGNTLISDWSCNNRLKYVSLPINRRQMNFSILETYIKENKVDIFHSPNNGFSIPFKKESKNIATLHDLSPLNYKHLTDKKYCDKFFLHMENTIENSDVIIAVSDFIKLELIKHYSMEDKKVKVIYPGCSNQFKPLIKDLCKSKLYDKYKINSDFLLYVGSIHPRKNLHVLLNVLKKVQYYNKDVQLILVGKISGKRFEYYEKLKILAKSLGIECSVIFTGIIDFKDMPLFYNSSLCTFNLSEYEGFPLTALESIACGVPMICSQIPIYEEVLLYRDLLVKIEDVNSLTDLVLEVINNKSFKNIIIDKYKKHIEKYNWSLTIKKTVSIYESVILS